MWISNQDELIPELKFISTWTLNLLYVLEIRHITHFLCLEFKYMQVLLIFLWLQFKHFGLREFSMYLRKFFRKSDKINNKKRRKNQVFLSQLFSPHFNPAGVFQRRIFSYTPWNASPESWKGLMMRVTSSRLNSRR